MSKSKIERIQDSVHGLMEFSGMETVVIDILRTPEIQRLRRIRQLGLAHLVFPGAEHSRFIHSLGASYLAIKFANQIKINVEDKLSEYLIPNDESIRDLAVATLCHDLGHGPFSHMWEREIVGEDKAVLSKWAEKYSLDLPEGIELKWHELIGQALLSWEDGQLHRLLEMHEKGSSTRIRMMLLGQYYIPYLPKIISSDIDADRADYIKRDTYQTGVAYGKYDLNWLISTCTVGKIHNKNELTIGFDSGKSHRVIEQFLIARRALYDTVYHHKTVRSAEGMVALFLKRLKDYIKENRDVKTSNLKNMKYLKPLVDIVNGEALDFPELLSLDDYYLWHVIDSISKEQLEDYTLKDLAERIISRNLFKIVPCNTEKINNFFKAHEHPREIIYQTIKPYCSGDPKYYLHIDEKEFKMFSEDPAKQLYLIKNENSGIGTAYDMKEDDTFMKYKDNTAVTRIFTVFEAVDSVKKLIDGY